MIPSCAKVKPKEDSPARLVIVNVRNFDSEFRTAEPVRFNVVCWGGGLRVEAGDLGGDSEFFGVRGGTPYGTVKDDVDDDGEAEGVTSRDLDCASSLRRNFIRFMFSTTTTTSSCACLMRSTPAMYVISRQLRPLMDRI